MRCIIDPLSFFLILIFQRGPWVLLESPILQQEGRRGGEVGLGCFHFLDVIQGRKLRIP